MRSLFIALIGLFLNTTLSLPTSAGVISHTVSFDQFQNGESLNGVDLGGGYYFVRIFGGEQVTRNIGGSNGNVAVDGNLFDGSGATQVIYRFDGGVFSVASFEMADLSGNPAGGGGTGGTSGSGYRIGFTGRSDIAYSPTSSIFTVVDVSSNPVFQDILSLGVNIVSLSGQDDFALDNIVLVRSEVPEPSTLVVFGLGTLYLTRRSRHKSKRTPA
jgi:hypothetical protein